MKGAAGYYSLFCFCSQCKEARKAEVRCKCGNLPNGWLADKTSMIPLCSECAAKAGYIW